MKTSRLAVVFIIASMLTACASAATPAPTATPIDLGEIQTSVVQTVVANITQTAAAQPTAVPTASSTPAPQQPTATATVAASATTSLCDNSAFVSDASVQDGSQMTAAQAFVKTWKVKNTGTCAWGTGYQIRWSYGEKMGGQSTPLSAAVQPGAEVEISVNMTAPAKSGTYGGYWRLFNNNGFAFGQFFSVVIVVP